MSRHRTALRFRSRCLLALLTPIYRVWMSTLRVRWICPPSSRKLIEAGPAIFALWHETLAATLYLQRGAGLIAMVSRHRDGEMITRMMEKFGFGTARGSTTRGGASALREMVRRAEEGHPLAITPDGPKGPRRQVQKGAIEIARRSGVPVIPVSPYFPRAHRFGSWDRMALPWPFARGFVLFDEPLIITADLAPAEGVHLLQQRLDTLTERAEAEFVELWQGGERHSPHPRRPRPRSEPREAAGEPTRAP